MVSLEGMILMEYFKPFCTCGNHTRMRGLEFAWESTTTAHTFVLYQGTKRLRILKRAQSTSTEHLLLVKNCSQALKMSKDRSKTNGKMSLAWKESRKQSDGGRGLGRRRNGSFVQWV